MLLTFRKLCGTALVVPRNVSDSSFLGGSGEKFHNVNCNVLIVEHESQLDCSGGVQSNNLAAPGLPVSSIHRMLLVHNLQ